MTLDRFPDPPELPRMYRQATPDGRDQTDRDWMADGLCTQTDPDIFTPEKGGSVKAAKDICANCDVRERCLQWALDHREDRGVWGGLTPSQRRKLRASSERLMAGHGTDARYRRGCHDDDQCPSVYTCGQAHRDYQREWDRQRRVNGNPRRQRTGDAA